MSRVVRATPAAGRTRLRRLAAPVATIGGLGVATVALHLRDPHTQGSWGVCPSLALFGIACPGCGGLRAVNDLTNGDLAAAASSNLLFVLSIPLIVFLLGRWAYDAWHGASRVHAWASTPVLYAGLTVILAFTVARNLPTGQWLAP
jgi:hypothetical protein